MKKTKKGTALLGKQGILGTQKKQSVGGNRFTAFFGFGGGKLETETPQAMSSANQSQAGSSVRFSNVRNLSVINTLTSSNADSVVAEDGTFMKQTMLEKTITMLTITRTLTCFFLTAFSVPFWIPTTFKAYNSELEPFTKTFESIYATGDMDAYTYAIDVFVARQKEKFDYILELTAPGYHYLDDDMGGVRTIDQIEVTFPGKYGDWIFNYNFHKTVRIYAGVEIVAMVAVSILLLIFIIIINIDVTKFVI